MVSSVATAARLSRRTALLLMAQATLAACSATPRTAARPTVTVGPGPTTAVPIPEATPTEAAFWPQIDAEGYRLQVTGLVDSPLSLTYETLRSLPKIAVERALVCSGEFFHDKSTWSGVPLDVLLTLAGPRPQATIATVITADKNECKVPLTEASTYVLAHEREGEPIVEKRGFPLRIVPATDEGWKWLKWVVEVRVT